MTVDEFNKNWRFFLALEDDLIRLARYIEPIGEHNLKATSIEISKLHNSACAAVETLLKSFADQIEPKKKHNKCTAKQLQGCITSNQIGNSIVDQKIIIRTFPGTYQPWILWDKKIPTWWNAYNTNKHNLNFTSSPYGECILSIAGLFILLTKFYDNYLDNGILAPKSQVVGADYWSSPPTYGDILTVSSGAFMH